MTGRLLSGSPLESLRAGLAYQSASFMAMTNQKQEGTVHVFNARLVTVSTNMPNYTTARFSTFWDPYNLVAQSIYVYISMYEGSDHEKVHTKDYLQECIGRISKSQDFADKGLGAYAGGGKIACMQALGVR